MMNSRKDQIIDYLRNKYGEPIVKDLLDKNILLFQHKEKWCKLDYVRGWSDFLQEDGTGSVVWSSNTDYTFYSSREARLVIYRYHIKNYPYYKFNLQNQLEICLVGYDNPKIATNKPSLAFRLPLPRDLLYKVLSYIPEHPMVRNLAESDQTRVIKEIVGYSFPTYLTSNVLNPLTGNYRNMISEPELRPYLLAKYGLAELVARSLVAWKGLDVEVINYQYLVPKFIEQIKALKTVPLERRHSELGRWVGLYLFDTGGSLSVWAEMHSDDVNVLIG